MKFKLINRKIDTAGSLTMGTPVFIILTGFRIRIDLMRIRI